MVAVMARMSPAARRTAIIDAALAVMRRKGIAATTVRDVAQEMGTSPGLVHHYFASMDELVATAFELAAGEGFETTKAAIAGADDPVERMRAVFSTYTRTEQDWAFQLWLDAWAEAARRPVLQATSERLNVAWQQMIVEVIADGVAAGVFVCADPEGSAWRIMSLLDGLALQTVAHPTVVDRDKVVDWSLAHAESELGLESGTLS
jgi:AcrR family transcriptional regulator